MLGKNEPELVQGTFPTKETECLVDSDVMQDFSLRIGDKISVNDTKETDGKILLHTELTIVGEAKSPLVINQEKGGASLGAR